MRWFQWNEAVPIGWIIVIYFILCFLENKYHRMRILCVIFDLILTCVAPLFIDDGYLPTITNKEAKTCDIVMDNHQYKVWLRNGGI